MPVAAEQDDYSKDYMYNIHDLGTDEFNSTQFHLMLSSMLALSITINGVYARRNDTTSKKIKDDIAQFMTLCTKDDTQSTLIQAFSTILIDKTSSQAHIEDFSSYIRPSRLGIELESGSVKARLPISKLYIEVSSLDDAMNKALSVSGNSNISSKIVKGNDRFLKIDYVICLARLSYEALKTNTDGLFSINKEAMKTWINKLHKVRESMETKASNQSGTISSVLSSVYTEAIPNVSHFASIFGVEESVNETRRDLLSVENVRTAREKGTNYIKLAKEIVTKENVKRMKDLFIELKSSQENRDALTSVCVSIGESIKTTITDGEFVKVVTGVEAVIRKRSAEAGKPLPEYTVEDVISSIQEFDVSNAVRSVVNSYNG